MKKLSLLLLSMLFAMPVLANDVKDNRNSPATVQVAMADEEENIHPEFLQRAKKYANFDHLVVPDLNKQSPKSKAGTNPKAQIQELTDTIIQMQGGEFGVDYALFIKAAFAISFNRDMPLQKQKCLNDKLNYTDYHAYLKQKVSHYVNHHDKKQTANYLKQLIDSKYATALYARQMLLAKGLDEEAFYQQMKRDKAIMQVVEAMNKEVDSNSELYQLTLSMGHFIDKQLRQCVPEMFNE